MGYCILLRDSLISWKSNKQTNVSKSYVGIEHWAVTNPRLGLTWLHYILKDFTVIQFTLTPLFCYNLTHCDKSLVSQTRKTDWDELLHCLTKIASKVDSSFIHAHTLVVGRCIRKSYSKKPFITLRNKFELHNIHCLTCEWLLRLLYFVSILCVCVYIYMYQVSLPCITHNISLTFTSLV